MKNIFSNNVILFGYFFIIAFIGLFTKTFFKNLLNKYGIFNVMIIEAIIGVCVLLPIVVYKYHNKHLTIYSELQKFTKKEIVFLLALAFFGIGTGYVGSNIIKSNDVSKLLIIDIVIGIVISFIGMYFIENKNISFKQVAGLIIIMIGSYLIL